MAIQGVFPNIDPLHSTAFQFLPLGAVKPKGWLKRQLRIQADGQSTALMDNWPDLMPQSTGWLGGSGESWERGPYYLDGMIPTAYLLEDRELINRLQLWIEWILKSQRPDGWFGPEKNDDWWPLMVALKALIQYQEATGDKRVIPFMERYFAYQQKELSQRPFHEWAKARGTENALSIIWLYNRNQDPELLRLLELTLSQTLDWADHFYNYSWDFVSTTENFKFTHERHIVNLAMALKNPAVRWLYSHDERHRNATYEAIRKLTKYHGQATGVFGGDEHLSGASPTRGTQLCSVVEMIFSLVYLAGINGDSFWGDHLELVTYNALPSTFDHEMWTHQFNQQANQVLCTDAPRDWVNNGNMSNLYGLEPNFGCCTSNYHQGWPKFISHMWMASSDGGLAAIAYGPSEVRTTIDGTGVSIYEDTDYPFRDTVTFTINVEKPITFPLYLRVPDWIQSITLSVNDKIETLDANDFHVVNREWHDGDKVNLRLPMHIQSHSRVNNAVSISRGPLIFSLQIDEDWIPYQGQAPLITYEVHPITPWNYALDLPGQNTKALENVAQIQEGSVSDYPFDPEQPPVRITMPARRCPSWTLLNNSAGPTPKSPVPLDLLESVEEIDLIPYGSTNLRVTEFPVAENLSD